jgi:Spy/CpxP family protein refolding chaperone
MKTKIARRALLTMLATSAAVPGLLAQGGRRGPGPDPAKMLETMSERLDLTPDQEEKIKTIFEEQAEKMREMRDSGKQGNERSAMFEKMTKIREESDKKIAEVLTPEQLDEYKKMQEERRGPMGGGRGPAGRGPQQ